MQQNCGICNAKILHTPCCVLLWSGVLSQELQFLSSFLLKMYTLPLMFHLRDGSSVYSTRLVRLDSLLIKSQVKLVTQTFSDSTHPYIPPAPFPGGDQLLAWLLNLSSSFVVQASHYLGLIEFLPLFRSSFQQTKASKKAMFH